MAESAASASARSRTDPSDLERDARRRDEEPPLAGRVIVIAGATSASGHAAAAALLADGARVVAVGRDEARLRELSVHDARSPDAGMPRVVDTQGAGELRTEVCDLTDEREVAALADRVHATLGPVDGVLHLVGGWRGGGGLAGQSDADYRFLEQGLTALRHVSRAFDSDLRRSDAARLAIVSSTAVARPLAGGANYAAVKAASEGWTRAIAQGFAKAARDSDQPLRAASVIFRVKALDGLEERLASAFIDLWSADPHEVNGTVVEL